MVHVVILEDADSIRVQRAVERVLADGAAFERIRSAVWLVSTRATADDVGRRLARDVPTARLVVLQLSGKWFSRVFGITARWFSSRVPSFH